MANYGHLENVKTRSYSEKKDLPDYGQTIQLSVSSQGGKNNVCLSTTLENDGAVPSKPTLPGMFTQKYKRLH